MSNVIKHNRKIFTSDGDIRGRVTKLENNVYKVTYYEIISGAAGTLTVPTGATINAGEFSGSNCVLSEIDGSNKVTWISPETAGGTVVTATLNTGTGAWTMSGTPTSANVALLYSVNIAASDYQNLNNFYIIEAETLSRIKGSVDAISGVIPFGDGTADTITNTTSFKYDSTNVGLIVGSTALAASTDITLFKKDQNAATAFRIQNTTSGTAAQSFLQLGDGTDGFNFGFTNTSFTPAGAIAAKAAYLQGTGTGGLVLQATNAAGHIKFTTGGSTVRAEIDEAGFINLGSYGTPSAQRLVTIGDTSAWVSIGSRVGTATSMAWYANQATPSSSNWFLRADGTTDVLMNSPGGALTFQANSTNRYVIAATNGSHTWTTGAASGNAITYFNWTAGNSVTQTASTAIPKATLTLGTCQWATGALAATQKGYNITQPTMSFVGASTATLAATVAISGAYNAGTSATITTSVGLLIESAAVNSVGTVTTSYGAYIEAMTGAGTNYALGVNGVSNFLGNVRLTQTVTTETVVSDTTVTIVINGTTYKLLARA